MSLLAQHIENIKKDEDLLIRLKYHPLNHRVVLGDYSEEYWVQAPEVLDQGETEICTVQELIECLKSEKQ